MGVGSGNNLKTQNLTGDRAGGGVDEAKRRKRPAVRAQSPDVSSLFTAASCTFVPSDISLTRSTQGL